MKSTLPPTAQHQLASALREMERDWHDRGFISSLRTYCNNSYDFPYSQLRKLVRLNYIRPISNSKRNKTYKWNAGQIISYEHTAQLILKNIKHVKKEHITLPKTLTGFSTHNINSDTEELQHDPTANERDHQGSNASMAIKIVLILKENGVPDERVEQAALSIIKLFTS
jgi:hypothetical protein